MFKETKRKAVRLDKIRNNYRYKIKNFKKMGSIRVRAICLLMVFVHEYLLLS